MEGGYSGKILFIDLAGSKTDRKELEVRLVKNFLGGFGINNRLAFDLIRPGTKWFAPENPIILGAGPFVGVLPGASKLVGTTKMPNGFIRTAVGGGGMGAMLKLAGFDHLVITGRAKKPVYLKIFDDDASIHDAGELWGKNIYETADWLWSKNGRECSLIAIGQAGERLIPISLAFIDKQNGSFGKGGLGAVMGSKNLKAIVIKGTTGIKIAQKKIFSKVFDDILHSVKTWEELQVVREFSWFAQEKFNKWTKRLGGVPSKNARTVYPKEKLKERFQETWEKQVNRTFLPCVGCPVSCKYKLELNEGENAGLVAYARPPSVMLMAGELNLEDWSQCLQFFDFVNKHGIDRHTAALLISWAVELYEREIINQEDTDGLILKHDYDTTINLLEKILKREGFGDILASGWKTAIKRIGRNSERYAVQVKGITPALDPRHLKFGTAILSEAINPGAHNAPGSSPSTLADSNIDAFEAWCDRANIPQGARKRIFSDRGNSLNIGRLTKHVEDWIHAQDCLGICIHGEIQRFYTGKNMVTIYSALTGIDISADELLKAGERAHNLERALNAREGYGREYDSVPQRWLEPISAKGEEFPASDYFETKNITKSDIDRFIEDYYEERGWDPRTGNPLNAKLKELELEFVMQDVKNPALKKPKHI